MIKICFATNNRHKLDEVRQLLGDQFTIVSLQEINCPDDLPETHPTLEENSRQKAEYVYTKFKIPCFADDSGLEVEALGGEPGVYSARYAGEQRNDNDNIDLLLQKLDGVENREAQFKAVLTFIDEDGQVNMFVGTVKGWIVEHRRGTSGFGYDPVFVPKGYSKTFAEMTPEEKNSISHRGRAVEKLIAYLKENYPQS